jgi:hypothetical protein
VLDHTLAELLAGAVAHVLLQDVAQQASIPAHDITDGEHELVTQRSAIHAAALVLDLFPSTGCVRTDRRVKILAAAGAAPYLPTIAMKANLRYWTSILREAERELEAATRAPR